MARQIITIDSVWGGKGSSQYFTSPDQYTHGIAIDPDQPITDSVGDRKTSGVLRPVGSADFSGANVNANPYWLITNPKDAKLYAILNNGRIVSYNSSFASETLEGTATSSSGNGAAYYNNFLYVATNTDIARFGPLSGAPTLTQTVWTGATLGSQTALVNTTYPSIRGSGTLPNHAMHVHVDGALYVCDFDSTSSTAGNRGRGLIHKIKTTFGTVEGDTNNSSAYNSLDLPLGYMPVDIESYGTDLVIAAFQTTNSTLKQGRAALFFWDTISDSFYNSVELPDSLVTALINANGTLYIFSGNISTGADVSNGYRLSYYAGGRSVEQIYYSNTGHPPLAGGVGSIGQKFIWGGFDTVQTTNAAAPDYYAGVFSYGSKDSRIKSGVHMISRASGAATAADGIVTAVVDAQQSSFSNPKVIAGWRNSSDFGIDQQSTTYGTSIWHSRIFNIGQRFKINKLRLNFSGSVTSTHTITPGFFMDDFSAKNSTGLAVINDSNYSGKRHAYYSDIRIAGDHNFCLFLEWTGTAVLPVLLPITIEIEPLND